MVLFLGIISWKGASCFNGGGMFFRLGGFIFKWGGGGGGGAGGGGAGVFKKNPWMGGVGVPHHALPLRETLMCRPRVLIFEKKWKFIETLFLWEKSICWNLYRFFCIRTFCTIQKSVKNLL